MFKKLHAFSRSAGLIILALCISAASTGVFFTKHFCHGRPSGLVLMKTVTITSTCACADDYAPAPRNNSAPVLKREGCCKDVSQFLKLQVQSQVQSFDKPAVEVAADCPGLQGTGESVSGGQPLFAFTGQEPPLKPGGRSLLISLSQLRIPLI